MEYSSKRILLIICSTKMRLDSGLSGRVAFAIREITPYRTMLIGCSKIVDQREHFMKLLGNIFQKIREGNIRRVGKIVIDVWKIDVCRTKFLIFFPFYIEILIIKNIFHSQKRYLKFKGWKRKSDFNSQ